MLALRMSIFPSNSLRGVWSWDGFCAWAVMPNVMAITEAMTPREILRVLVALQFN
jgi:hypothetical protein